MHTVIPLTLGLLTVCPLPAQAEDDPTVLERAADTDALNKWLAEYERGTIRLASKGQLVVEEFERARKLMAGVARWDSLAAAKQLFAIATIHIRAPGTSTSSTSEVDFATELRIYQVRSAARKLIAKMKNEAVERWLLAVAIKRRGKGYKDVSSAAGAALRILANRPGAAAKEALLRGCRSMKPAVRVQAVNSLSIAATLELVPHFLSLTKDKEPYVRIASINGLGRALAPHTDETIHTRIEPHVAKLRDSAILKMGEALVRDRVWQVRAAARANLASLKSKAVIPALIKGLAAELRLKKDPWALDVRLHRTLEGLTGLSMPLGQVQTWELFWRNEGASFAFARAGADPKPGSKGVRESRYEKFFNLDLESDRVMFVVDFSGSMMEDITLKTKGVGTAGAGATRQTTKAKLVVDELKKMVMSLQDGDLFNIIVFSDGVRVWRSRPDGRPALVKMNDDLRDDLLGGYLDNLKPAGLTNLHGALAKALGFGGRGLHDKYYKLGYDTLYILSDGAPTTGKVTDTEEILRLVREVNGLKRLTIHTITFGNLNQLLFLKKLAEQNGGRHVHIE